MTNPDAIAEIVERLERANGPDRKLDAEIACAIVFRNLRPATPDDHKESLRGAKPSDGNIWCPTGFLIADSYTASIDAALTLVPEGWHIDCLATADLGAPENSPRRLSFASLRPNADNDAGWMMGGLSTRANTPAIALCIASLKARQSP